MSKKNNKQNFDINGEKNIVAGRDINVYGISSLSEEFRKRLKFIEDRINRKFPQRFISPSRNNEKEPFSCDRLMESLLFVGIPLDAAISIVEHIEAHLTKVLKEVAQPSTHHIRQSVIRSIYTLDPQRFSPEEVQKWGDRYARQYGNPDFRTKVLQRDGSVNYLSHRFLKEEFLPHLIEDALGVNYERLKTKVISKTQLGEMAETIITYVRTMNFYQIRYKTLFHLAYDIAVQPPHPWFAVEEVVEDIVNYDLERARVHLQLLQEEQEVQRIFHSIGECLHHASSAILAIYGNVIGCGYLSPLLNLINSLKMFQFQEENLLLEFCDFKQIEGDLEAIGLSIPGFLRRLSFIYKKFFEVRSSFSEEETAKLKKDAHFLLSTAEKLIDSRRRYKSVIAEIESKQIFALAKDVFARIPSCKVPEGEEVAISCQDASSFYVQHNIDTTFFRALNSPFLLVVVFLAPPLDTEIKKFFSCIRQDMLSNVLVIISPSELTQDIKKQVKASLQEEDKNIVCVISSKDLISLYHAKDRRIALESLLLKTRLL